MAADDTTFGSRTSTSAGLTRREAFKTLAGVAGVAVAGAFETTPSLASARQEGSAASLTTPRDAIVKTSAGDVRGFKRGGVYTFRGIPYGADTSGPARFLPPKPPATWPGVRWSLLYGPVCPQPPQDVHEVERLFVEDSDPGRPGEDCLRANVWTPALGPASKLPVIVWLHGGGFVSGSSQEHPAYDGESTARKGAVFVSVNHRLGALGFMDLSSIGGGFERSPNAGMLDLVLALEWTRDNIAAFGGDPSRVTIVGQSGGGGKVSTLMAMPAARGLFHGAVVMSGSFPLTNRGAAPREIAKGIADELGLKGLDAAALQKTDAARLVEAGTVTTKKLGGFGGGFAPVVDGEIVSEDWATSAPRISAGVPMIIGSVRDEFRPVGMSIAENALPGAVPERFKTRASEIVAAARRAYPQLPPTELAAMLGGMWMRSLAVEQARKKHALAGASVYSYWFTWPTPLLDGAVGCPHGIDIAFLFDNVTLCDQLTGNTPEVQGISGTMNEALLAFAATGNPSRANREWRPYDPASVPTMVFDTQSAMALDPAGDVRRLME